MKNILYLVIVLNLFFTNHYISNAEGECSSYSSKSNYELYKERVKCICEPEYKINDIFINIENNYLEITKENPYSLNEIKLIHKTNMNNIYKCALLSIQKKSLLLIKNDLIQKNVNLNKRIGGLLNIQISNITSDLKKLKCIHSKNKSSIQKLSVLKQTTYQTCKYISYLEYLKEYNSIIENILPKDKNEHKIGDISIIMNDRIGKLNIEIEHIYKIFPLVFRAYTEYENNISIHFLLQLIKDDYIVLRQKLHDALNPINQVVYKIANAMKK